MPQPAARSTFSMFAKVWRVWAATSPGPTRRPPPSMPTCPATTTISPAGATIPGEYIPSVGPSSFDVTARGAMVAGSAQAHVLELERPAVDAAGRGRDPAREASRLGDGLHQAAHEGLILGGGEPVVVARVPLRLAQHAAVGRHLDVGEAADGAAEGTVRQSELDVDPMAPDHLVPPVHATLAVRYVVVAQPLVERDQRRLLAGSDAVPGQIRHRVGGTLEGVVVVLLHLLEAPLEAHGVEVGRVGGHLGAEEVQRHRAVEVDVLLDGGEVDAAVLAHVLGAMLAHELAGALDDALHPRFAHEHVVGLLGEHEAARAGERVESALGETGELVLAVAVGEEAEHEEGQPVWRRLVEGAEDTGLIGVTGAPLEQRLGFLAPVPAEVRVEEVHHGLEVATFLHVDLEEVAEVIQRRARAAEVLLLLHRGGLGVALGHDEPAQDAAVLAGHLLPGRAALVIAEVHRALGLGLGEEDTPAIVRHANVVEIRPALRVHAHRGPEVDVLGLEAERPHVLPPLEELGLPVLERALEPPVLGEVDVVGNPLRVVDAGHQTLLRSNAARSPVPYTLRAPPAPTAFGRWKIQFCHAERRAKILLSRVSGPPNRSEASMPVSASGENAARSSSAMRTSSSQSMSSGAKVTRPASSAAAASRSWPSRPLRSSARAGSSRKRLASRPRPLTMG